MLLVAGRILVDREFRADLGARGVEALCADGGAGTVCGGVVGRPGHHEAAVGQGRDGGFVLVAGDVRVGQQVAGDRRAVGPEDAQADAAVAVVVAGGDVVRAPGDGEVAVG